MYVSKSYRSVAQHFQNSLCRQTVNGGVENKEAATQVRSGFRFITSFRSTPLVGRWKTEDEGVWSPRRRNNVTTAYAVQWEQG